jgi:hypothetical protein
VALQGTFQQLQRHHCHNDIIDEHNIIIINTISSCLSVWRFLTYSKYLLLAAYLYGDSLHMPNITSLSFATYLYGDSLYNSIYHSLSTHLVGHWLTHARTNILTHRHRLICIGRLLTHSLTHSLIYSLTHSLTHSSTHSLTHSSTHSLTHSLTHLLTHYLVGHWPYSLTGLG